MEIGMIEIANLTKIYRTREKEITALDHVAMSVRAGEYVAVKGPSGCGKTTLLLVTGGLLQPESGSVLISGQDFSVLSPDERSRFRSENIGFVFQQFYLVPYLTALENILCPSLAKPFKEAGDTAMALLKQFHLEERRNHLPGKLSTGEKQRVALARALLNHPRILLADEPTGNLDEENADIVLESLREFARSGGAVLLVTHDARAANTADRVIPMREGRITAPGYLTPESNRSAE